MAERTGMERTENEAAYIALMTAKRDLLREKDAIKVRVRELNREILAVERKVQTERSPLYRAHMEIKRAKYPLKPYSQTFKAREVIFNAGKPMHAADILRGIGEDDPRYQPSLVAALSACVAKNLVFVRTGPNTFGLIELGHTNDQDNAHEQNLNP